MLIFNKDYIIKNLFTMNVKYSHNHSRSCNCGPNHLLQTLSYKKASGAGTWGFDERQLVHDLFNISARSLPQNLLQRIGTARLRDGEFRLDMHE